VNVKHQDDDGSSIDWKLSVYWAILYPGSLLFLSLGGSLRKNRGAELQVEGFGCKFRFQAWENV